jgi:hypothetical protein
MMWTRKMAENGGEKQEVNKELRRQIARSVCTAHRKHPLRLLAEPGCVAHKEA